MDFQLEELQALSVGDVVRESIRIPRSAPRTFAMITLSLIFPLSFAILAHSLLTHPIIRHLQLSSAASSSASEWARLFALQFAYLLFLFTFSLLSTAAIVFSVASLYASKPITFRSAISAVVPIFPRLFKTFLWVSLLMLVYNLAFLLCIVLLFVLVDDKKSVFFILLAILVACFLIAHVGISALWHLASVISVLEPLCGLAAMRKSYQLLHGRARMAAALVVIYLGVCGALGWAFRATVVRGPYEEGSFGFGAPMRFFAGTVLVMLLVLVNLVGLLVQSVFYYVCKSYHHQSIDRSALYDHLGGYLGEYVPLKSSIQMESL